MLRRAFALATASLLALSARVPAMAQVQRSFPQTALRGVIFFGDAPEILLNGQAARLAPGSRIRDLNNMTTVPGPLGGGKFLVNYTIDLYGLVKDVWILTAAEAANQPWPTTPDQAAAWTFDPSAQTWTKP